MEIDTHSFMDWQLPLVSLRVVAENNAMLRVLIANQITIMDKLKIDYAFPDIVFNDILPVEQQANREDRLYAFDCYVKNINTMADLIMDRTEEYAQLRIRIKGKEE